MQSTRSLSPAFGATIVGRRSGAGGGVAGLCGCCGSGQRASSRGVQAARTSDANAPPRISRRCIARARHSSKSRRARPRRPRPQQRAPHRLARRIVHHGGFTFVRRWARGTPRDSRRRRRRSAAFRECGIGDRKQLEGVLERIVVATSDDDPADLSSERAVLLAHPRPRAPLARAASAADRPEADGLAARARDGDLVGHMEALGEADVRLGLARQHACNRRRGGEEEGGPPSDDPSEGGPLVRPPSSRSDTLILPWPNEDPSSYPRPPWGSTRSEPASDRAAWATSMTRCIPA